MNNRIESIEDMHARAHPGGGPYVSQQTNQSLVEDIYQAQLANLDIALKSKIAHRLAALSDELDDLRLKRYASVVDSLTESLCSGIVVIADAEPQQQSRQDSSIHLKTMANHLATFIIASSRRDFINQFNSLLDLKKYDQLKNIILDVQPSVFSSPEDRREMALFKNYIIKAIDRLNVKSVTPQHIDADSQFIQRIESAKSVLNELDLRISGLRDDLKSRAIGRLRELPNYKKIYLIEHLDSVVAAASGGDSVFRRADMNLLTKIEEFISAVRSDEVLMNVFSGDV